MSGVPGPTGPHRTPSEPALYKEVLKAPKAVKMAGGPRREVPWAWQGFRSRTGVVTEVPAGSPEEGAGLGRPPGRTRRLAGRWRSPTCRPAPARPLTWSPGRPSRSPAPSSRRAPATESRGLGPRRQGSSGAGAQAPPGPRPPRSRGQQRLAGLASPAPASAAAAALAPARSGSGLFIHPFTLPPQTSLRLAPPSLTSPPRLPAAPPLSCLGRAGARKWGAPPPRTGWGAATTSGCRFAASGGLAHPRPACRLPPTAVCGCDPHPHSLRGPTFSTWALDTLHRVAARGAETGKEIGEILKRTRKLEIPPPPAASAQDILCACVLIPSRLGS